MAKPTTQSIKAQKREAPIQGRANLLVVEDEQDLQDLLRYNLEREGYRVTSVSNGEKALKTIRDEVPDLVILDLMLPGIDGLEVCRHLKQEQDTSAIPIIMLTAKSEESDVVTGLELGADDYLTKPFSPRVLLARVKALLRRRYSDFQESNTTSESAVRIGELTILPDRHEVQAAGKLIDLTATEFRLLHLLAGRPGRVFTRTQIIQTIHGDMCAVSDRSVDVQIVTLRRKLGSVGKDLQTVRGVGYRYKDV